MKPESQREAIAEFCGWKDLRWIQAVIGGTTPRLYGNLDDHMDQWVPYYEQDLNAMHEVEIELSHSDFRIYLGFLNHTRVIPHLMNMEEFQGCWNATAAQRAKALLRTIGKWKD